MSNIGTLLMVVSTDLPSVTVIIPTFRSADVIERALDSVLAQTHQPAEIIVVDDASGDQTPELLHQLAATDSRIRVLENELNIGPGRSRNRGWDAAKTELVAFLDADDSWDPAKLEIQCRWMKDNPLDVACGTLHRIATDQSSFNQNVPVEYFGLRHLLLRNRFSTPSVVLRRALTERFSSELRFSEDYLLWMLIAARYGSVVRINQRLTILHKPVYGAGGLSGRTLSMFIGELQAIREVRRKRYLGPAMSWIAFSWSTVKFIKRLPKSVCGHLRAHL
jgi:glycosyltransferase involved in cell wall biosynthesis